MGREMDEETRRKISEGMKEYHHEKKERRAVGKINVKNEDGETTSFFFDDEL
jgi:hypothetical protein